MEFKYVKSKPGQVVKRYGTDTFIGCKLVLEKGGFEWSDNIIRISFDEWTRYIKEYNRAVKDGALTLCTKENWEAQQNQTIKAEEKEIKAEKRKKKGEKQHPETK